MHACRKDTDHHYQALLDSSEVETCAELARFLGVGRARVTQVLNRFKEADGETFEVLPSDDSDFVRDREHYYCRENVDTNREFFHRFGKLFIMLGVVKEGVVIDNRGIQFPRQRLPMPNANRDFN